MEYLLVMFLGACKSILITASYQGNLLDHSKVRKAKVKFASSNIGSLCEVFPVCAGYHISVLNFVAQQIDAMEQIWELCSQHPECMSILEQCGLKAGTCPKGDIVPAILWLQAGTDVLEAYLKEKGLI